MATGDKTVIASKEYVDTEVGNIDLSTKQDNLVSGTNIKTVNGNSITGSGDLAIDVGGDLTVAFYSTTDTFVVPAGVTSIRIYAVGGGGDGAGAPTSNYHNSGGGGGGMAYGDLAVSPTDNVTITIAAKVATVTYSGTDVLIGNTGSDGVAVASGGGAGGTATKDVLITNGGAYSGGAGFYANTGGISAGGGSAGSPLGTGKTPGYGGAGIGTVQSNTYAGGGAGNATADYGTYISGGAYTSGMGRSGIEIPLFTDPLLVSAVSSGVRYVVEYPDTNYPATSGHGAGGHYTYSATTLSIGGHGGNFGGGGAATSTSTFANCTGGNGGLLGGGGSAGGDTGTYIGGKGGFGGGGGGAQTQGGTAIGGIGGGACVIIMY